MNNKVIIILLAALTGLQCGNKSDSDNKIHHKGKDLQLKKITKVILNSDSIQFGRFRQHFVHSNDDKYWAFHDITKQQIVVFTSAGEFKTTIGSRGRGPAEFENVYGYNFSEDNTIWAFDENLNVFKHFNLNDSLLSTISGIYEDKFFQSHPQIFINNQKIYIPITEAAFNTNDFSQLWRSAFVAVYDFEGKFLHTLGTFGNPVKNPFTYNVRAMLDFDFEKEKMLASFSTSHKLGEYNLQDLSHTYFGILTPNFMVPDEQTKVNDSYNQIFEKALRRSSPMASFITDKYYIFHYQNLSQEWYDTRNPNTKNNFLIIYHRRNKDYIGELKLPFALGNISKNGNIRLIESIDPDQFTISTYTLTIIDD